MGSPRRDGGDHSGRHRHLALSHPVYRYEGEENRAVHPLCPFRLLGRPIDRYWLPIPG